MKNKSIDKVYESLLHPKYEWRTIRGIVKQTKLSQEEVEESLKVLIKKDQVRKAYVPYVTGDDLYGLISRVDRDMKI